MYTVVIVEVNAYVEPCIVQYRCCSIIRVTKLDPLDRKTLSANFVN